MEKKKSRPDAGLVTNSLAFKICQPRIKVCKSSMATGHDVEL